jgi:hypothetical protein
MKVVGSRVREKCDGPSSALSRHRDGFDDIVAQTESGVFRSLDDAPA